MQNQYDDTNRGAAFRREKKSENAPTWSGPLNVDGKELEISIWEKTSKAGSEFLSIKVGPPWKPQEKVNRWHDAKVETPRTTDADDGDSIPF